jgi:hypothetical protein
MFRPIMIAVAAAALITAGAATAFAANSHGKAVSNLAATTTLSGAAKGDAISVLASAKGETTSDNAKAEATADAADRDTEADADATTDNTSSDKDAHGDAVSAVAKSDATAAHEDGAKKVNHGGAVSAVAQQH